MVVLVEEKLLKVTESVVTAELDGEAVLLNVETGTYFGLDRIGSDIWRYLEQGSTESQIAEQLMRDYEVDEAMLRVDLAEFLVLLESKGLVQPDARRAG